MNMSEVNVIVDGVEIEDVRRLSLKPGDIVMLSTERIVPSDEGERIRNEVKSFLRRLGHENEVVFMDGGLTIEVIG
jgi:pyruvate kinase